MRFIKLIEKTRIYSISEGVDANEIVKRHIVLLHRYNEAKDATQASFLNLAVALIYVLTPR